MADNRYNSGRQSAAPRQDRRQAFLADEQERRIKEAAARRRAEEERLRREAAAAREAARREAKRREQLERELAVKRRERENYSTYKSRRRRYEQQRRADAERRRREKAEMRERARRRRHNKRVFKFHFAIFAFAAVVFTVVIGVLIHRNFYSDLSDRSRSVSYYFDGEKAYSASADVAYCGGKMCFNFSDVAERCGFYVAGDRSAMKYVVPADDGYDNTIEFIIGSDTALVNGTQVSLGAVSRYIDSSLWVSCEACGLFETGLTFERSGAGRLNITRVRSTDEDGKYRRDSSGRYLYDAISFTYKPMISGRTLDLVALYGSDAKGLGRGSDVVFKSDLSSYEAYMNPSDSNEYLMIVNGANPLDVSYIPDDLIDLVDSRKDGRATQRLRKYAGKALEAMFIEMREEGFKGVTVTSGFTSYIEQGNFFQKAVNREMNINGLSEADARIAAAVYIDPPGTSDLQTGLSAVFHDLPESSLAFANEDVYKWLKENSWKFGFTERYPEGKEEVTGHAFDPCHFRYVGRFVAEWLHKTGECLEEYMAD